MQKQKAREARWAANRWAVPYPTDGPKVTLGVFWFVCLIGAALLGFNYDNAAVSSVAVAVVTSVVADPGRVSRSDSPGSLATAPPARGPQVRRVHRRHRRILWAVGCGVRVGVSALVILSVYLVLYRGHKRAPAQLFDVLARAAIPVGLAAASMGAMAYRNLPVLIALILFVSAYEVGDFLVGSGAFNPVEGPMAGLIAAGVVAFFLFLIQPDPFTSQSVFVFVAVAAVGCVAGQYLGSALLPRGNAWAPALRRLDSYLIPAPLWLMMLVLMG